MLARGNQSIIEARKDAADIINGVLNEDVDFRLAIKCFPRQTNDESLICALHALMYYDADDEYRAADPEYAAEQKEYLGYIADLLSRGEDIPANIVVEYKKFFKSTPIILKDGIVNIIKSLFRFIS